MRDVCCETRILFKYFKMLTSIMSIPAQLLMHIDTYAGFDTIIGGTDHNEMKHSKRTTNACI